MFRRILRVSGQIRARNSSGFDKLYQIGTRCDSFRDFQGSGKTYTIGGNVAILTDDEFGILPRAIRDMYQHMQVTSIGSSESIY